MKIVTVCTHSERYFPCLLKSLERFGERPVVLEWGKKWTGFAQKMFAVMKYLRSLDPDEVVCVIDAFDCIVLQPPSELERRFRETNKKMIIARDGECPNFLIQYFIGTVFPKVAGVPVSAGSYVGYAGYVLDLFQTIERHGWTSNNDNEILPRWANKHYGTFSIDVNSELFLTLYTCRSFTPTNKRTIPEDVAFVQTQRYKELLWKPTKTFPIILHAPGDGNINGILRELGYTIPTSILNYSEIDHLRYLVKMTKSHYVLAKEEMIYSFVMILLIVVILALFGVFVGKNVYRLVRRK